MARPTKADKDRFSHRLPAIRCTESDIRVIKQKAEKSNSSLSEYIRQMALDGEIIVQQGNDNFPLLQELKRSGNNLNQVSRWFNEQGVEPIELREVLATHNLVLTKLLNSL